MKIPIHCPGCSEVFELDTSLTENLNRSVSRFYTHIKSKHSASFPCGVPGCPSSFPNGEHHINHLKSVHSFTTSGNPLLSGLSTDAPPAFPDSIIFQDPRQDHDVYVSYCTNNTAGGSAITSPFHDPKKITAELSKHFKPWIDNVCLGSAQSGDFYKDRALALQKVKIVVAFVSPEYVASEQCKMEYEFAYKSLNKPILPVIIRDGIQTTIIESYIREAEVIPFRLDAAIKNDADFKQKMGYLVEAVKRMINTADARRETIRMSYMTLDSSAPPRHPASSAPPAPSAPPPELSSSDRPPTYEEFLTREQAQIGQNIRQRVPQVGDHVISHHFKYAYYTSTIISFDEARMEYTIKWDDGDPSGRVQPVSKVALNKKPSPDEVNIGTRVFFQQGGYSGTAGNNSGGGRYHEGIVSHITGKGNKTKYHGYHAYGADDGKWVTYKGYSYNFSASLNELRIAPNPYNAMMSYNMAPPPFYS